MTDTHRSQDWPGPDELDQRPGATPYVGIAGFTDPHEVRSIAADLYTMSAYGTPSSGGRRLAVGVLVSAKTLGGEPAGNPERYPRIEDVRGLLDAAVAPIRLGGIGPDAEGVRCEIKDRTLRLIHYNSRKPDLAGQVDRLCAIAGPNLDGFQFNIVWPDADEIRAIATARPRLRLVLQVNREMFSNVARKPKLLADEIGKKYGDWITDILFDMSGGTGKAIDMSEATSVLDALYGAFKGADEGGLGIGIAGGLDYKNVYDLKPLFERWPDLSIDAEGRIRDSYVNAKKETVTWLNEGAREFARRGIALARDVLGRETTP